MMNVIGHGVLRLVRIRFGPVKLGELPAGEWRDLDESERDSLRVLAERVEGRVINERSVDSSKSRGRH